MGGSTSEARAVATLAGLGGTGRGSGVAAWRLVASGPGAPRAAWGPIVVGARTDEACEAARRATGPEGARSDRRPAPPGAAKHAAASETCTPTVPRTRLRHGSCSLRGRRRTNEDYVLEDLANPARPLFGVADGCGGEPLGDAMSRVACCAARRAWGGGADLRTALVRANEDVLRAQALSEAPDAGTTLLLASVLPTGEADVCWAGDSRAFVVSTTGMRPLTCDDDRDTYGFLANALGMRGMRAHLARTRLGPGDRLLLATDGVWEPLGEDAARILGAPGEEGRAAGDSARALCAAAVERGADNASAVVVVMEDMQVEACGEEGRRDERTRM